MAVVSSDLDEATTKVGLSHDPYVVVDAVFGNWPEADPAATSRAYQRDAARMPGFLCIAARGPTGGIQSN